MSDADRKRQLASIRRGTDRPKLDSFKSKRSKWVAEFQRRFGHDLDEDGMAFIDKHLLAKEGIEQILDKGRAAYYTSGSRPNQTAESWARARLAAVIVGNAGTKKSGARKVDGHIWEEHRRRTDKVGVPFVSDRIHKKYSVYVMCNGRKRLLHFGDNRYQQYRDRAGVFAALDHSNKRRRDRYYQRHGASDDKCSAKYWSHRILW